LTGHTAGVRSVAFSPDGQTLASGSEDETIILWDVDADSSSFGQPLAPPLTGLVGVFGLAFSPDGQMLASGGGFEDTFILWNVAGVRASSDGQALSLYRISDTDDVKSVAYNPDGQVVALGSWFNTVTLWDVAGGQPLGPPLTGHSGVVTGVAYSPDGGLLASASDDHSIMLWDTGLESWQARACRRANRNLTQAEWQQFFGNQPYRATCPDLPGRRSK
jgi:WD40 repeat protein